MLPKSIFHIQGAQKLFLLLINGWLETIEGFSRFVWKGKVDQDNISCYDLEGGKIGSSCINPRTKWQWGKAEIFRTMDW